MQIILHTTYTKVLHENNYQVNLKDVFNYTYNLRKPTFKKVGIISFLNDKMIYDLHG